MTEQEAIKEALRLAGTMADAAIRVTGGRGLNWDIGPCGIYALSKRAEELRIAAEAYNYHITQWTREKK